MYYAVGYGQSEGVRGDISDMKQYRGVTIYLYIAIHKEFNISYRNTKYVSQYIAKG